MNAALVAVLMGSSSDYPVMKGAVEILDRFSVTHEVRVLSAHRTPHDMLEFAATAESRGFEVLIAGAGGAAHLPGMLAAATVLPVIGVRSVSPSCRASTLAVDRADADRSTGRDRSRSTTRETPPLLAVRMLAIADAPLRSDLHAYAEELAASARSQTEQLGSD
jgi:phosphoribosylcarboxyaminoimidazole (NCAIR) mutase